MADGSDCRCLAIQKSVSLPQIAELIEILLRLLPVKHLLVAAQVCKLWRYIARRLRVTRRYSVAYFVENLYASVPTFDLIRPALRFIDELYIEPSAIILFANFHPMQNFCVPKRMLQKLYRDHLPKRCVLAGCTGRPIIGSTIFNNNINNDFLQTWEVERRKCLSLLFVPRAAEVSVRSFYIPLKNKYKKIRGVRAFLPDVCDVKLVVVFAHPLSLGKLTHLTVAVRDKYGDGVTIAGGYSDTFLFHGKEVTSNEIVGLVFGGNLQATSVVFEHKRGTARLESLNQAMTRLQNSGVSQNNSFGLIFTCSTREDEVDVKRNKDCIQSFGVNFPNTPLAGFSGTAAFGCDVEVLKLQERKPGGRDFLQTNATVLCVCSIGSFPGPSPRFFKDGVGQKKLGLE